MKKLLFPLAIMSLVGAAYDSSDEEQPSQHAPPAASRSQGAVAAAPDVTIDVWSHKLWTILQRANPAIGP